MPERQLEIPVSAQHTTDGSREKNIFAKVKYFVGRHVYICAFIVILIGWLPWILAFLPGSLPYDGCKLIQQGLGEVPLTDQHSWVLAIVMGALMRLGRHVSDNAGLFLIMAVFVLFELLCYSGVCKVVSRWKLPRPLQIALPFFYGFFPIFGAYAQAVVKDSVFMAAFTLYMALYLDLALRGREEKSNCKKESQKSSGRNRDFLLELLLLLLIGYVACAVRNNGIYMVFFSSASLIILFRKGLRKYAVFLLLGAMTLNWFHDSVLAEAVGVTSVTDRAKMSITFQIAGRYMSEYPEDLTEDEREALGAVFYGLDSVDEIGELYNPQLSDPVKAHYRTSATEEEVNAYMEVIVSMFKKHPGVCIQALLNQAYGYIYPFHNTNVMASYQIYITKTTTSSYEGLDVFYVMDAQARIRLIHYTRFWENTPVFAQVTNAAFPTWVLFLLAGYLACRKKWKEILVLGAPSLNMAICAVSPVNGLLRYAMPSMACLPLLVLWCVMVKEDSMEDIC